MPLWFSDDRCLAEQLLFVTKASRGTRAAYRLVEAFMKFAEADFQHVKAGVSTGVGTSAERLYLKFGLQCVGSNFTKHF
jgi:GNAT superfamily N-acetyltransferase